MNVKWQCKIISKAYYKCVFRCENPCPIGKHGSECKSVCRCQNNGTCDPETGHCFCKDGWTGLVCANRCPFGFWGMNCSQPCDCYNGASCNHINGSCECQPGFTGIRVSNFFMQFKTLNGNDWNSSNSIFELDFWMFYWFLLNFSGSCYGIDLWFLLYVSCL